VLVGIVIGVAAYNRDARASSVRLNWGVEFESRMYDWRLASMHYAQESSFRYRVNKTILDMQLATNANDENIELEALIYWCSVANLSRDPAEVEIAVEALKLFSQGVRIKDPQRFVRRPWGQTLVKGSGTPELELPGLFDPRWPLEPHMLR